MELDQQFKEMEIGILSNSEGILELEKQFKETENS
jgi:hypothetical protein